MTTLSSMFCLQEYKDITPTFDIEAHLIPPKVHTQHFDATNAYNNLVELF